MNSLQVPSTGKYPIAQGLNGMKKAITYYRVSTERQGESGLGLLAQKKAVRDFAKANQYQLQSEFVEVESGKKNNRPVLIEALERCKRANATLLIAKLDRLGRNVAFISRLMESGVDFKAVDNPYANKLVVHMMAVFAEHERDLISQRTVAALKAAKSRGVVLGEFGRNVLSKRNKLRALCFARDMQPVIDGIMVRGITTMRGIAAELNRKEIPTYRKAGQKWHPSHVHQLIKRIDNNIKPI
jgi:DNA invertase Pin-like site-specific DNA recombinase